MQKPTLGAPRLAPVLLHDSHDLGAFDCGMPPLDEWLSAERSGAKALWRSTHDLIIQVKNRSSRSGQLGAGSRSLNVDEIKPALDSFKPRIDPIDPSMDTGHALGNAGHPVLQGRLPLFQSRNPSFQITHVVDHPIEFLVEPPQHRQN
jgi:hypothetical protein